jgi:hypothetical protein
MPDPDTQFPQPGVDELRKIKMINDVATCTKFILDKYGPHNFLGRVQELYEKIEYLGGLTRTLVERKLAEIDARELG